MYFSSATNANFHIKVGHIVVTTVTKNLCPIVGIVVHCYIFKLKHHEPETGTAYGCNLIGRFGESRIEFPKKSRIEGFEDYSVVGFSTRSSLDFGV